MLVLKKLSTKKLIGYILVIAVMFGGTGFMIYKNYQLTNQKPPALNTPAEIDIGIAPEGGETAPEPAKIDIEPGQPLAETKRLNIKGFDLTIFLSEKFKALKENVIVIQASPVLGKRDPFKPD
jgi:hypothetical protein